MFRHTIFAGLFATLFVLPGFSVPLKDKNGLEINNKHYSDAEIACEAVSLGYTSGHLLSKAKWIPNVYEFVLDDTIYASNIDENGENAEIHSSYESVFSKYEHGVYSNLAGARIGDESYKIEWIINIPSKSGYYFMGFFTEKYNGGTRLIEPNGRILSELQNIIPGNGEDGAKGTLYAQWGKCRPCSTTNASCELSVVNNVCTYTTTCNTGYDNIQNNGEYNASCSTGVYTISYENMTDATNYDDAPTSYIYGSGATIDGIPTKPNNVFGGWCTDSALTDCAMTQTIGTDAAGDKIFYAKWKIKCKPGTYLPAGTNECVACAKNKYCPGTEYIDEFPREDQGIDFSKIKCEPGTYLPAHANECTVCLEDNYCVGTGLINVFQDYDQGIDPCSNVEDGGPRSPAGSKVPADCGHILHLGDGDENKLYLHADKEGPSFVIEIDGKPWYGSMTEIGDNVLKPISSKDGAKKFHVKVNGKEYTVHGRYVE